MANVVAGESHRLPILQIARAGLSLIPLGMLSALSVATKLLTTLIGIASNITTQNIFRCLLLAGNRLLISIDSTSA